MEIRYSTHALQRMRKRRVREEHIRFTLESGEFIGYSDDGVGELWQARILRRRIGVVVEWLSDSVALVRTVWG